MLVTVRTGIRLLNNHTNITAEFTKEFLKVKVFQTRDQLGKAAAENVSKRIKRLLQEQDEVSIIFAAAPSQDEFLEELSKKDLKWQKIIAFHMDEYIGLDKNSKQLFGNYLKEHLFDKVPFKKINFIEPFSDPEQECRRYENLLKNNPVDIVCFGIGENAHIAFNDPSAADFNDPSYVKIVKLEEACRRQQVNDGSFPYLNEVPLKAVTLTIPALMSAKHLSGVVPGKRKAAAVYNSLSSKISPYVPASIIRKHSSAVLFLDTESAVRVLE
jgi:glucosamine-6-phosphate deaminase